jgi:hypothetical protein
MVKYVQCANIKFCCKLGKRATETHDMLVTAYGSHAVTKKTVFMLNVFFDKEGIVHSEKATEMAEQVDAPSQQCTLLCITLHLPVFDT